MQLSEQQKFILFSLGRCYDECNKRFSETPLQINMSKARFIELSRAAGMVHKGERAMYKNLEDLERKKLVSYEKRSLKLSSRGEKQFQKLLKQVGPYVAVSTLLSTTDVMKFTKVQAKFK